MNAYDDPHEPLVSELRTLFARIDPVPPVVTKAAKAALGWGRLDADLAELLADSALDEQAVAGARGVGAPARSVSFSAGELTIEIEIHADGAERMLLGQLTPRSGVTIEIQTADAAAVAVAESDALGRFRVKLRDGGPIRLRVRTQGPDSPALVETSWITI